MNNARRLVEQWFEQGWNERNEAAQRSLLAPGVQGYATTGEEMPIEQFFEFRAALLDAFPDLKLELLDVMEEGDRVAIRWRADGTHSGDGLGFPASGRVFGFVGSTWWRLEGDRICEGRDFWDQGAMREALTL
jgi:steroid delta-isomerase-like uncharacterized protein